MYRKNPTHCLSGHEFAVVGKNNSGLCKECDKIHSKKYRQTHSHVLRNSQYRVKFGMTLEQYNQMFQDQKGLCLGCYKHQSEFKRAFAVDHGHKTGNIRGLLCLNCNVALGNAQDNPTILRRLADYIEQKDK